MAFTANLLRSNNIKHFDRNSEHRGVTNDLEVIVSVKKFF